MILISGKTILRQVAGETERYTLDYSRYLNPDESVTSLAPINVDAGIAVTVENPNTILVVSPATGQYKFALKADTSSGRVRIWDIFVDVEAV